MITEVLVRTSVLSLSVLLFLCCSSKPEPADSTGAEPSVEVALETPLESQENSEDFIAGPLVFSGYGNEAKEGEILSLSYDQQKLTLNYSSQDLPFNDRIRLSPFPQAFLPLEPDYLTFIEMQEERGSLAVVKLFRENEPILIVGDNISESFSILPELSLSKILENGRVAFLQNQEEFHIQPGEILEWSDQEKFYRLMLLYSYIPREPNESDPEIADRPVKSCDLVIMIAPIG